MSSEALRSSQPRPSNSRAATIFRNPFVAVAVGIVLPLLCLAYDPIVFRASFGKPILGSFIISGYGFIALSALALGAWLPLRRFPSIFCGFLFAGCLFALAVGIVLLPISVIGLLIVIGILGFSPFLTAATFWHCAKHARELAGNKFQPGLAALAFAVLVALPISAQAFAFHIRDQSLAVLVDGTDETSQRAVRRLKMLGPIFDADTLVSRYVETDSQPARERIASAYHELTGRDVEDRLERLLD